MAGKVYLNGTLVDPADARISILDRGFLYGDSVYEVMRVYDGVPFAFAAHSERLYASGRRVEFELPWLPAEIKDVTARTLAAAGLEDAYLRIIATRGSGELNLDPTRARDPNLIVMALELPRLPPESYEEGRSAWLVGIRRNVKGALDPEAKTGNYMNSVLAQHEARQRGADEAIMLDLEGRVAEASSANVFARLDNVWHTPPVEVGILSGITRRVILDVCAREGIPAVCQVLWPEDLRAAREIFVCSSVREIVPVVTLDAQRIGDGHVGAATRELHERYREEVRLQTRS